jgi:hypothetical protein
LRVPLGNGVSFFQQPSIDQNQDSGRCERFRDARDTKRLIKGARGARFQIRKSINEVVTAFSWNEHADGDARQVVLPLDLRDLAIEATRDFGSE